MTKFYIVFPSGDKTKLAVISLSDSCSYELDDYCLASRRDFNEISDVIDYAKKLANKHNLELDSSEKDIKKELNYLD